MSGGSLDYCENKILDVVCGIEKRIDSAKREIPVGYSQEVLDILEQTALKGREFAIMAHEAEWAFSGDTSLDNLKQRIEERIAELYKARGLK